jgi:phosphopantetheinyl transferase (holo-ACP synthase)
MVLGFGMDLVEIEQISKMYRRSAKSWNSTGSLKQIAEKSNG